MLVAGRGSMRTDSWIREWIWRISPCERSTLSPIISGVQRSRASVDDRERRFKRTDDLTSAARVIEVVLPAGAVRVGEGRGLGTRLAQDVA